MLGDGYLHKTSNKHPNSYFVKKQCKKYKEYVEWHHEQFSPFSISINKVFSEHKLSFNKETQKIEREQVKKHLSAYTFKTCSHPIFTELRNIWYPNGKKIVPKNIELTPLSIAIWFCDDGSNNYEQRQATFCTHSFTSKEVRFLCKKLKDFDIKANVRFAKYASGKKPILKVNSQSYDTLINIVKPYIEWDCMKHKINWRSAKKQWEYSGKFTEDQITEIRDLRETKSAREIANQFEVHVNTIYAIVSGRSWKHMEAA